MTMASSSFDLLEIVYRALSPLGPLPKRKEDCLYMIVLDNTFDYMTDAVYRLINGPFDKHLTDIFRDVL